MNIHVPQSLEAQIEARCLMAVPHQIVSSQANKPCIGLVQDALLGAFLLSRDGITISRRQMVELWGLLKYCKKQVPPFRAEFTGKEAINLFLPEGLNYYNGKADPPVVCRNGFLVSGRLCKQSLGTAYGSMVHHIWLTYGPHICAHFLSDAQRLINRWLMWRGFSVRLSDCRPPAGVEDSVNSLVRFAEDKVRRLETHPDVAVRVPELCEHAVSAITNRTLTDVGKVVHASLDENMNSLYQTVGAGSKGNLINVAQLIGAVGQQSLEGRRIDGTKAQYARIPPTEPESFIRPKGFVKNSYFRGLDLAEFFYHSMAGREGLVDTAVKTATTGYLQRRLMKAMETLKVEYDGTVRNSRDHVIQFVYGGDGYDGAYLLKYYLCHCADSDPPGPGEFLTEREAAAYARAAAAVNVGDRKDVVVYTPVRCEEAVHEEEVAQCPEAAKVLPEQAAMLIDALCAKVCPLWCRNRSALELQIRWELRTGRRDGVCARLCYPALLRVSRKIQIQIRRALVAAGEMVGAVAAQSIGEPTSQSTLNTFHHAGVASKNVTLGLCRLTELIACTKTIRTPAMQLVPLPSFLGCRVLTQSIVHATLQTVTSSWRLIYEPEYFSSSVEGDDHYLVAREKIFCDQEPKTFSPWVARIILDQESLARRKLTPAAVASAVRLSVAGVQVVNSEWSMKEWVLRIRPVDIKCDGADPKGFYFALTEEVGSKAMRECYLAGIPSVTDVCETKGGRLETSGTNLRVALGLPEIDSTQTLSNDVGDVLATLGIEAATRVLFDELQTTLHFDGSYLNQRHTLLLVCLMTSLGHMLPISRHGLNRLQDNGPIAQCSFEETVPLRHELIVYVFVRTVKFRSLSQLHAERERPGRHSS
jgi:DNA-directed RNA polymerase II subunit RPB1